MPLHRAAGFEQVDLPTDLVTKRLLQEAKGVQVLDLRALAERRAGPPHGNVGVASQRTFLQVAVRDPEMAHQRVQSAKVGRRLRGRAQFRFADNLQERHSGAVEVDARVAGVVLVQRLAGVLLQVGAGERDAARAVRAVDFQLAAAHDGLSQLADLVALGQVRVEVVLAVEAASLGNLPAHGHAEQHRHAHRLGVQRRQHARQRQIHLARLRVRGCAERRGGAGEQFGARAQLHMHFQADHAFPAHGVLRLSQTARGRDRAFALSAPPQGGRRKCQSVSRWNASPSANNRSSQKCGPISCMPIGSGCAVNPQGTLSAGKPAKLAGAVNASWR